MLQPTYSFEELKMGSQLVRDLISETVSVKPLVNKFFDPVKIKEFAEKRSFSPQFRQVLYNALKKQNEGIVLHESIEKNIESIIDDRTFTITTGHQLNLLSGPLYAIYKIAQCISHADALNKQFPDLNFVPVFWMATEDHDFEEINHIHLFGKKID